MSEGCAGEKFAVGLMTMIGPVVDTVDASVRQVFESQVLDPLLLVPILILLPALYLKLLLTAPAQKEGAFCFGVRCAAGESHGGLEHG